MSEASCILLAEDDEGHATLIRKNLGRAGLSADTIHLRDGQELLDYVYRCGSWSQRPPHRSLAIVADLNMPRLGGLDVLQRLKKDQRHSHIPIFVLTTTDNPSELERCYTKGASACLVKPLDPAAFTEVIRRLAEFLSTARLPAEAAVDGGPCAP